MFFAALGVPDLLAGGPKSNQQLAKTTGAQAVATMRVSLRPSGMPSVQAPENAAILNQAMVDLTRPAAQRVLSAYDFSKFRKVIDVGGGIGDELIVAIPIKNGLSVSERVTGTMPGSPRRLVHWLATSH